MDQWVNRASMVEEYDLKRSALYSKSIKKKHWCKKIEGKYHFNKTFLDRVAKFRSELEREAMSCTYNETIRPIFIVRCLAKRNKTTESAWWTYVSSDIYKPLKRERKILDTRISAKLIQYVRFMRRVK